MKKPGSAVLLFMTGTGNTARAAGLIETQLQAVGWTPTTAELRRGADLPNGAIDADLLVFCFPVLGFGMPNLVRDLLKGLKGRGQPAAAFATWGGDGSIALWQARLFLWRKGFRVIATGGASYPFQWTQVMAPTSGADARRMTDTGDGESRAFAKQLAVRSESGRIFHPEIKARHIIPLILGPPVSFLYSWIGRFGLAAMYAADERCKACGNCERDCPAGAIQVSQFRTGVHLLLNTAVIIAIILGLNRLADAASLPALLSVPACILALIALSVLGSRLQFSALEPVLFALEGVPSMRRLLNRSWTTRFPRCRCDGFKPRQG
jgi:ferredoxin